MFRTRTEVTKLFSFIAIPAILLVLFLLYIFFWKVFDAPSLERMVSMLQVYYERYGYWVVLVGALAEGLLLLNWYLPGSVVVVFGVVFAKEGSLNPILVVGVIILGFFITTLVNFVLGKYGWYRLLLRFGLSNALERIKQKTEAKGLSIIFSTYFHPNVGALTATSAGILQYPIKRFVSYSLIALILWNSLWGSIVYVSGPLILNLLTTWVVVGVLVVWTVVLGVKYRQHHHSEHINIP